MRVAALVLCAVFAFAPVAVAETQTPAPSVETESEAPAPPAEAGAVVESDTAAEPELICRTIRVRTESRLPSRERVCRTQSQWDAEEQQDRGGRQTSRGGR
jgi:hypothetical protein